jgi:hypothetical protein
MCHSCAARPATPRQVSEPREKTRAYDGRDPARSCTGSVGALVSITRGRSGTGSYASARMDLPRQPSERRAQSFRTSLEERLHQGEDAHVSRRTNCTRQRSHSSPWRTRFLSGEDPTHRARDAGPLPSDLTPLAGGGAPLARGPRSPRERCFSSPEIPFSSPSRSSADLRKLLRTLPPPETKCNGFERRG